MVVRPSEAKLLTHLARAMQFCHGDLSLPCRA
jgi:hypothetical protein